MLTLLLMGVLVKWHCSVHGTGVCFSYLAQPLSGPRRARSRPFLKLLWEKKSKEPQVTTTSSELSHPSLLLLDFLSLPVLPQAGMAKVPVCNMPLGGGN